MEHAPACVALNPIAFYSKINLALKVKQFYRSAMAKIPNITSGLTLTLIQERIGHSIPGIWKVIKRKKIQPAFVIGKLKLYTPEQADLIGGMMRSYNYKSK